MPKANLNSLRSTQRLTLIAILFFAGFIRLFGSTQYVPFWEEQVDDMLSIRTIWQNISTGNYKNLSLKGQSGTYRSAYLKDKELNPVYHGVAYYYVLLPIAVASNFNPYGVVLFLIVIGIITVYLLYLVGILLFEQVSVGLFAAFLGAVSFWLSAYSRWIWTPSMMPFFSLLAWASFLHVIRGKLKWWYPLVISLSLGTQIHDSGYVPLVFFIVALLIYRPVLPQGFWKRLGLLGLGIIPIIPTFIHEVSNGFHMTLALSKVAYNAVPTLLTMGQSMTRFLRSAVGITIMNLPYIQSIGAYLARQYLQIIAVSFVGLVAVYFLLRKSQSSLGKSSPSLLLGFRNQKLVVLWWALCLPVSVLIEYLYADQVLNDYSRMNNFAFALPIFLLCVAYVCVRLWQTRYFIARAVVVGAVFVFILLNGLIIRDYLWTYTERDWAYQDLKTISWLIPHHAGDDPYELIVYRYHEGSYEDKNVYVMLYFIETYPARMPEKFNGITTWGVTHQSLLGRPVHQRMIVIDKRYEGKRELPKNAQRIGESVGYALYRESF